MTLLLTNVFILKPETELNMFKKRIEQTRFYKTVLETAWHYWRFMLQVDIYAGLHYNQRPL